MKVFMKLVFYVGFLFFGGGFLIAFGHFVIHNGLGNIFEYKKADYFHISSDTTSMPAKLIYEYVVNGKIHKGHQNVSTKIAKLEDLSKFTVLYNVHFNSFSLIKEL